MLCVLKETLYYTRIIEIHLRQPVELDRPCFQLDSIGGRRPNRRPPVVWDPDDFHAICISFEGEPPASLDSSLSTGHLIRMIVIGWLRLTWTTGSG